MIVEEKRCAYIQVILTSKKMNHNSLPGTLKIESKHTGLNFKGI